MDWEAFYNRFREPNFIPGYEIQNRLGGGAFGEVYKARKHSIGKAYAIKFLKIDDEAQRDAVERELEQVRHFAVIDHPNLVTIEDLGTVMGVPFLIMGYAGEDTLARRLRQGELERELALSYFVQACRGVLALHDRRLVHFDLKPSNVFLKGDVARVGDYGLSKMMTDGRLTLSFGRGTPHYMAPEMLRNRADHRADVYSLGVILFESFARRLPYESAVPGTLAVRENDAPPLFTPGFPAALRPVVERCLRLAPEDRYSSVGEMLEEMGQTARPGDSVRVARLDVSSKAAPAAKHASEPEAARPGKGGDKPSSEARRTAAELARGAVEVARGMWDGIRTASAGRSGTTPPVRGNASHAESPAVTRPMRAEPTTPELGSPLPGTESSGPRGSAPTAAGSATHVQPSAIGSASASPDSSARPVPDATSQSESRTTDEAPREIIAMHVLRSDGAEVRLHDMAARVEGRSPSGDERGDRSGDDRGLRAVTIPVPPPVQGGILGTLVATLALALEVFLSLARGLARSALALIVRGSTAASQAGIGIAGGARGFATGALRLFLFLLVMVLLGVIVTGIAVLLMHSNGSST